MASPERLAGPLTRAGRRALFVVALASALAAPCARAEARVTFDRETLGRMLAALATQELSLPTSPGSSLRVVLDEVTLLRLEPPAQGERGAGRIWVRLRARVPQLGLDLPLETAVTLDVVEHEHASWLEIRFLRVPLALPVGAVDLAPLVPPLRYPAGGDFVLAGASGDVTVHSRAIRVGLDAEGLTLHLALEFGAAGR